MIIGISVTHTDCILCTRHILVLRVVITECFICHFVGFMRLARFYSISHWLNTPYLALNFPNWFLPIKMQAAMIAQSRMEMLSNLRKAAATGGRRRHLRSHELRRWCRSLCHSCCARLSSRSSCRSGWASVWVWIWGLAWDRRTAARGPARQPPPHCTPLRSVCSAKRGGRAPRSQATSCSSSRTISTRTSTSRDQSATSSLPLSASPRHRCASIYPVNPLLNGEENSMNNSFIYYTYTVRIYDNNSYLSRRIGENLVPESANVCKSVLLLNP